MARAITRIKAKINSTGINQRSLLSFSLFVFRNSRFSSRSSGLLDSVLLELEEALFLERTFPRFLFSRNESLEFLLKPAPPVIYSFFAKVKPYSMVAMGVN